MGLKIGDKVVIKDRGRYVLPEGELTGTIQSKSGEGNEVFINGYSDGVAMNSVVMMFDDFPRTLPFEDGALELIKE